MGHDVRTAHEGSTAQHIARNFMPEFAFLDIGMPGLNGYDLARLLRQFPETHQCVLVAVTGWGQDKDRDLSRSAGFNHHLVKPVELAQILSIIEKGTALVNDTDDGHRRTNHSH
jgi:CheY-like chemotaxis protein